MDSSDCQIVRRATRLAREKGLKGAVFCPIEVEFGCDPLGCPYANLGSNPASEEDRLQEALLRELEGKETINAFNCRRRAAGRERS